MYTHPKVLDNLTNWAEQASQLVDKYLDLTTPFLLEHPRISPKHQFVLKHLAISCNYTSHSALMLIANGSLWEAEMLIRSTLEGSLKYTFLCVGGNNEELDEKVEEYWETLFEISQLREHQKSAHLLSLINESDAQEWKPIKNKLLEQSELEQLQKKYPKKLRQSIEQKWSFSEIIQSLAKYNAEEFNALTGLAYTYSLGSHLVHQDSFAVRLIWDRNQREEERKSALELAHGGRECSDILMMARLRTSMTYKLHSEDRTPIKEVRALESDLQSLIEKAYDSWLKIEYKSS